MDKMVRCCSRTRRVLRLIPWVPRVPAWFYNASRALIRDMAKYYRVDPNCARRSRPIGTIRALADGAVLPRWRRSSGSRGAASARATATDAGRQRPSDSMAAYIVRRLGLGCSSSWRQSADLSSCFSRQHARRHGAPEHRRQARHAREIAVKEGTRFDRPLYGTPKSRARRQ